MISLHLTAAQNASVRGIENFPWTKSSVYSRLPKNFPKTAALSRTIISARETMAMPSSNGTYPISKLHQCVQSPQSGRSIGSKNCKNLCGQSCMATKNVGMLVLEKSAHLSRLRMPSFVAPGRCNIRCKYVCIVATKIKSSSTLLPTPKVS